MSRKSPEMSLIRNAILATAGVGLLCICMRHRSRIWEQLRNALDFRNPLRHRRIQIVETPEECHRVVDLLKKHCNSFQVLGFDCEWVTVGGTRRPTALLQLSSHEGLCALFRLCCLKHIPKSLRDLLEDDAVLKVGVAPQDDAKKMCHDFSVGVASTLDLRFLAALAGFRPGGLAKLSKALLNVQLDKNWRLACSDWEAKVLSDKQLTYAANDALVAVEIFKKLVLQMEPRHFWQLGLPNLKPIVDRLRPFVDVHFKESYIQNLDSKATPKPFTATTKNSNKLQSKSAKMQTRGIGTRSKALYDNCLLEAPDGELLCTIDRRKAQWYLEQNLGTEVNTEPFTVRLNFEPAGRAVGEVGQYYQTPKENQCVVCGRRDVYIRKNVVPREYRRHFPEVMKFHSSHDILLLCPICHQTSNISDLKVRLYLAEKCGAPFSHGEGAVKVIEVPELKHLRAAGRALLNYGPMIPEARREELKETILSHFKEEQELTTELLETAANVETTVANEHYSQHGERVVQQYQQEFGGLIELERLWRQHFLDTMKPNFLPSLWNVNHNADRLEIRASEGRVDQQDLIVAGLSPPQENIKA